MIVLLHHVINVQIMGHCEYSKWVRNQLKQSLTKMSALFFLLLVSLFISPSFQVCVWYEQCNREGTKIQNCVSDGTPGQLHEESLKIFEQKCPLFLKQFPENKYCCDDVQVETMVENMDYAAGMFQRCPTCIDNLNQHICAVTCSPNQSDFIEVKETKENGNMQNKTYISKINFHLSKEYKELTFDSCKEVTAPSTGEKAMSMACGIWGAADQCTAERWFDYFGDYVNNPVTPCHINYNPPFNPLYKPLDIKVLPCNESYENQRACSCSDCEASCTIPFEHSSHPDPFKVGGMNGVDFMMIVCFGVVGTAVLVLLVRHHRSHQDDNPNPAEEKKFNSLTRFGSRMKQTLTVLFTKWGTFSARNPVLVFAVSSWIIAGLGYGVSNLIITTDPTEIWASPTCESRQDKTYFDSRFKPFYRTNQVFIKSKGLKSFTWTSSDNFTYEFGPAFNSEFLTEVYKLQMQIQKLGADEGKGLEKICFAPMKNEFFNGDSTDYCAIQSVWGYLQNNLAEINETSVFYDKLQGCLRNNFNPDCLAPYGGPIFSSLAVGGQAEVNNSDAVHDKYLLATGITLTFIVNNAVDKTDLEPALIWEKMFIDFMKTWSKYSRPELMEVAFSAERSIQDEIERESKAEMTTIIVSYFVMFVYITIALGRIRGFSSLLLDTKFTLGIGGIVIVLSSVIISLGVFGYMGVATTLLTIEVIPFLVLAVGVDNIFILVHTYQQLREERNKSIEEEIGMALGKVGPSILLTSTSEAACFLIGTLSDMPAIKTFAEYSSLAIVFNFLLQISCFVSLLALDSRRQKNNYADIFCCVKVKKAEPQEKPSNILFFVFENYYGPFLMKPWVRMSVIMLFLLWGCLSIACIPRIEKGLDQELSMPEDSHVIKYFQFMKDLLSVGPPVYFVIKNGINFTNPTEVNAVCGSVGCDSDSLVTYLTRASRLANISYIGKSPSSWIDDYFDWLSSPSGKCCKEFRENGSFCPHQYLDCDSCALTVEDWRPRSDDFKKYLPYFLNDNPDMKCPKAGHAAYSEGVNFEFSEWGQLEVTDNYFMAYHTSLKTSRDFYMALENARKIAQHLSKVLTTKINRPIEVFPYSVFYVYYEQYLTIVEDALLSLSLSLLAVFGVTFLFTGFDFKSSALVCFVVTSLLIDMTGMLYWWNITLNAVSLVNLLVAVGIGVEFCSHVMHAFVSSTKPDRISKALSAIGSMGSSVFSGITLTKFLGIVVLAFAQTLMLRTFYFKMYLGIVIMGAAHGLILMPVLLSYFG